eukprot:6491069-Amphidinium_carterae.1
MEMAKTMPIDTDSFNPMTAETDRQSYLWVTWLTKSQFDSYLINGTVPGYKETRGDNVHKHHRIRNRPDHCVNLAIHTRWSTPADNSIYGATVLIFLLVWKTSIHNVITTSHHQGNAY